MPPHQRSSSSKKFRSYSGQGPILKPLQKSLCVKAIDRQRAANEARHRQYVQARVLIRQKLGTKPCEAVEDDGDWVMDEGGIFDSDFAAEVSSATEPNSIDEEFYETLFQDIRSATSRSDPSTRRDRNERLHQGFARQMNDLVNAYMDWAYRTSDLGHEGGLSPDPRNTSAQGTACIILLDVFATRSATYAMLETDQGIAAALVRQGMIPCAPFSPKYAVSIRTLDIFKNLRCRCPHLTVQPFVKGILDMLGISCSTSYYTLFSTAFDVYIEILELTRQMVLKALKRDSGQWRLKNTCPACSYKLEGEPKLTFEMLIAMDGNNSLKRFRQARSSGGDNSTDNQQEYTWRDRPDLRTAPGDYYISCEDVNKWAKGLDAESTSNQSPSPCSSRWRNMIQETTSRMWSVFDETGIFLSLCRHGFVLLVADMVQSGELSKYPLAMVNALLNVFGSDIGIGYDIGCQFKTTVARSRLRELASTLNYKSLIGSFHGHAHNRLCQLSHLATYVKGLGLEDLEGCERFFSKSNALARSVRYASAFHRKQSIVLLFRHMDNLETYANLSKFLVCNYKQATEILKTETTLRSEMKTQGIPDTGVFADWLREEQVYLEGLKQEPIQDTLEMEYYQRLVVFYEYEHDIEAQRSTFYNSTPQTLSQRDHTRSMETKRRQLIEKRDKVLDLIHDLERKLGIQPEDRWVPSSLEWATAAEKVRVRNYKKNLDNLESLVVARIFELSKVNMPQTGYKLRQHITKALQARSQAIKTALKKYNDAAASLSPPAPQLSWDQVVQYAFLSDFDLLRCARQDIRTKPWANPSNRVIRDQYFKLERAREEIERLNVEIRRVLTYMRDEELILFNYESCLKPTQPELAHQIGLYRHERSRSNALHKQRFKKLSVLPGFSGDLNPGTSTSCTVTEEHVPQRRPDVPMNNDSDEEDNADGLAEDITYSLLAISLDNHSDGQNVNYSLEQ